MLTKEDILREIRRTAKENGGTPFGRDRFIKETGITEWELYKYWPRFGDALVEAGFKPNQFNSAYDEKFVFDKYISLVRELGKIPVRGDLRVKRHKDLHFPADGVFARFGGKNQLLQKVLEYAEKKELNDIVELCNNELEKQGTINDIDDFKKELIGSVYLVKSGRYYKIGRTNNMDRRHQEITIILPEGLTLIHEIKTDDPSGIENYWHRRFESKRKNGEWFDLNSTDIKAFKRWKKIA